MTITKKLILAGGLTLLTAAVLLREMRPPAARRDGRQVARQYARLPLSFEANAGQTGAPVQFLSRGRGYTLFLTSTEAVLSLHPPKTGNTHAPGAAAAKPSCSVRMQLVNANPAPVAAGRQELPGKSNYFIGSDPAQWRTNVPTYAKVEYRGVYPGVDLVYYGNGRQLEHDFIVSPGASPREISLNFPDAGQVSLNARGDLLIEAAGEQVALEAPVIYQQSGARKNIIAGHYVLQGERRVGFAVAEYDHRAPLVIDPVLVYSTYVGGSNEDFGTDIAVDASGSAYVVGEA